jgi:hypothetical protein
VGKKAEIHLVEGTDHRVTSKPWQKRQDHCSRCAVPGAGAIPVAVTSDFKANRHRPRSGGGSCFSSMRLWLSMRRASAYRHICFAQIRFGDQGVVPCTELCAYRLASDCQSVRFATNRLNLRRAKLMRRGKRSTKSATSLKSPRGRQPASSRVLDYPASISGYERESLAAEAQIADKRKTAKRAKRRNFAATRKTT